MVVNMTDKQIVQIALCLGTSAQSILDSNVLEYITNIQLASVEAPLIIESKKSWHEIVQVGG